MEDDRIRKIGLPEDVIYKVPYISICGNKEMIIQNHRGILDFCDNHILVRCEKYKVSIKGKALEIDSYSADEIIIRGIVESFSYICG